MGTLKSGIKICAFFVIYLELVNGNRNCRLSNKEYDVHDLEKFENFDGYLGKCERQCDQNLKCTVAILIEHKKTWGSISISTYTCHLKDTTSVLTRNEQTRMGFKYCGKIMGGTFLCLGVCI